MQRAKYTYRVHTSTQFSLRASTNYFSFFLSFFFVCFLCWLKRDVYIFNQGKVMSLTKWRKKKNWSETQRYVAFNSLVLENEYHRHNRIFFFHFRGFFFFFYVTFAYLLCVIQFKFSLYYGRYIVKYSIWHMKPLTFSTICVDHQRHSFNLIVLFFLKPTSPGKTFCLSLVPLTNFEVISIIRFLSFDCLFIEMKFSNRMLILHF